MGWEWGWWERGPTMCGNTAAMAGRDSGDGVGVDPSPSRWLLRWSYKVDRKDKIPAKKKKRTQRKIDLAKNTSHIDLGVVPESLLIPNTSRTKSISRSTPLSAAHGPRRRAWVGRFRRRA
ncbi:hypothetical protein QVD17_09556 [Tagetes erecta]|uniref:Uncharacterized protein n=1 Tax=Tagetes erecta TaxID=13708 RepID=A0AAD8L154_TARER|nr:hypothetical protein QVD17_09556 [Tagetes erecta]